MFTDDLIRKKEKTWLWKKGVCTSKLYHTSTKHATVIKVRLNIQLHVAAKKEHSLHYLLVCYTTKNS